MDGVPEREPAWLAPTGPRYEKRWGPDRVAYCSVGTSGATLEVLKSRYRPSKLTNGSMADPE